jgi:hypothetical protein
MQVELLLVMICEITLLRMWVLTPDNFPYRHEIPVMLKKNPNSCHFQDAKKTCVHNASHAWGKLNTLV